MDTTVKPEAQESAVPPPSEYDSLTVQLHQNPHQPETWRRLVNVAEATGDISKISAAYDALLKQYPNTVCWRSCPHFRFSFLFGPSLDTWCLRLPLKFNISTTIWTLSPRLTRPKIYSKNSWELRRVWNFGNFIWLMWGTFWSFFVPCFKRKNFPTNFVYFRWISQTEQCWKRSTRWCSKVLWVYSESCRARQG